MIENLIYIGLLLGFTATVGLSFFYYFIYRNILLILSFAVMGTSLLGSVFVLMGRPVSPNIVTQVVYNDVDQGRLLWFELREGKWILLLLQNVHSVNPLYLKLPWNPKVAEQIQKMQQQSGVDHAQSGHAGENSVTSPMAGGLETRPNDFKHQSPPKEFNIEKPREQLLELK